MLLKGVGAECPSIRATKREATTDGGHLPLRNSHLCMLGERKRGHFILAGALDLRQSAAGGGRVTKLLVERQVTLADFCIGKVLHLEFCLPGGTTQRHALGRKLSRKMGSSSKYNKVLLRWQKENPLAGRSKHSYLVTRSYKLWPVDVFI